MQSVIVVKPHFCDPFLGLRWWLCGVDYCCHLFAREFPSSALRNTLQATLSYDGGGLAFWCYNNKRWRKLGHCKRFHPGLSSCWGVENLVINWLFCIYEKLSSIAECYFWIGPIGKFVVWVCKPISKRNKMACSSQYIWCSFMSTQWKATAPCGSALRDGSEQTCARLSLECAVVS